MNKYKTYFDGFKRDRKFWIDWLVWMPGSLDTEVSENLFFFTKNLFLLSYIFRNFCLDFSWIFHNYFVLKNTNIQGQKTLVNQSESKYEDLASLITVYGSKGCERATSAVNQERVRARTSGRVNRNMQTLPLNKTTSFWTVYKYSFFVLFFNFFLFLCLIL